MPRPGGTRHAGGGRSVSGHRIGGSFYQHSAGPFQSSRPGGAFHSTLPSRRSSSGGGLGMGGLSGPIFYELGRQSGRRQAGGFGGYGMPGGPGYDGPGPGGFGAGPTYSETRPPGGGGNGGAPGSTGASTNRGCSPGCLTIILIAFVLMLLFTLMGGLSGGNGQSTVERHKIENAPAFDKQCLIDELYWISDGDSALASMESFYEDTGVQPYFIFKKYDPSLASDSEKDAWAAAYYEKNIDRENGFLVVYFAEANTDYDVGYLCQVTGTQAKSVMDEEALQIFWNNLDKHWAGEGSTEEVLAKTYSDTASTIMRVSTTSKDITKWLIIAVLVLGILAAASFLIRERNRRAKEQAEETERILKTPLEKYSDKESDELIDKYGDGSTKGSAAEAPPESAGESQSAEATQDPMRTATDDLIDKYKDPQ